MPVRNFKPITPGTRGRSNLVNDENENLFLSSRNNQNVAVVSTEEINVLDLVATNYLLIEESSVKKLEEVLN